MRGQVRRRLGDRRGRPRFDIVGDLLLSMEAELRLPLKDISRSGALIHSHVPLPPESIHTMSVNANSEAFTTLVKVKHVTDVTAGDGERTFLLGVEFVAPHPAVLGLIEKLAAASASESEPADA
jgi:hypothetical protein